MSSTPTFDELDRRRAARCYPPPARWRELVDGETLSGRVLRLPAPGAYAGNRLFLRTATEVIAVRATAKRGHSVLERLLIDERVHASLRIRTSG
jgi:hypothetical protein